MRALNYLLLVLLATLVIGCSSDDDEEADQNDDQTDEGVHPAGYAAGDQHGIDFKLQENGLTCTSANCHGEDLTGRDGTGSASANSCDECHTPSDPQAWRSDCTFCHGGTDNLTGAPPQNLDNTTTFDTEFSAHSAHVEDGIATGNTDCTQCHARPASLLAAGHVLDSTPGNAEIDFSAGFNTAGTYENGSCSNMYCHGNGQGNNGTIADGAGPLSCSSCHAGVTSTDAWSEMSGFHNLHLTEDDITCTNCHNDTTENDISISNIANHVNNEKNVAFNETTIEFDAAAGTCAGTCHGVTHSDFPWSF